MNIVICSKGYPKNYKKNIPIKNIENFKLKKNVSIVHAGTKKSGNKIVSNGGRVLNIISKGNSFKHIRKNISASTANTG